MSKLATLLLFAAVLALPAPAQTKTRLDSMDPERRRLFESWAESKKKAATAGAAFAGLSLSEQTTFDAVTHALSKAKMTSADGKALGTALDLIESIEEIAGQYHDKRGDEQFRVYCVLKPTAKKTLADAKEFFRDKDNTVYHKQYPVNFRQGGKMPSIQFSIARDSMRADIDVDYLSSKAPQGLFNGHLTAANSDVRAKNNIRRHNSKYAGLVDWWRSLFRSSDVTAEVEPAPPARAASVVPADRPENAEMNSASDAVQEFLTDALVRRDTSEALGILSPTAEACVNDDDDAESEKMTAAQVRSEILEILNEANKRLGRRASLSAAVSAVNPHDVSYRVVAHPFQQDFSLAEVSDQEAAEFLCRASSPAEGQDVHAVYGNWAVATFRFNVQDSAALQLLLRKEAGGWRIVSYDLVEG